MFKQIVLFIIPTICYSFTPIRNIIATQAFTSSLIKSINQEIITDNSVIKDILYNHRHLAWDLFYTSIFALTLFSQYALFSDKTAWENIELYSSERKKFNIVLTIFVVIFARNVENAI